MKNLFKVFFPLIFVFLVACDDKSSFWVTTWEQTTSLSTKRAGATVVTHNEFIYVIGGVDGSKFLNTTEYTKVNADGSLAPWMKGPSMHEARGFVDAVIHKKYVYVVGGGKGAYGKVLLRTVERAPILPDGKLGPWEKEKNAMNMRRRCSKVIVARDRIYSLGGFGGDMLNTVEHAQIKEDATLDEWFEEGEKLIELRYISGAKKVGEIVYVVGGHHQTEGAGINNVEWSKVIDEAGFQPWKETAALQVGRYGLAVVSHDNYLYALGGLSGVDYLDSVEVGKTLGTGVIDPWRFSTPLATPRAMLSAVVYKDWIYVIGGTSGDGYLKSVEYAAFNRSGDIGHWLNKDELASYNKKSIKKDEPSKRVLPNEGIVMEVIATKKYIYILSANGDELSWLAAPKAVFTIGDRILYSKGVYMSNFYSKELGKKFDSILFVGTVKRKVSEK